MEIKLIKIQVDGTSYEVRPGRNLLHTCLSLGFDIPYFCFHPALGSVGACRQCAVRKFQNADDKTGRIVMSCMEPVTEGLIISTNDPEVKAFRAAIIESLMTNHPHDCPICDEGGECHLQDMTVMTGHTYRRFNFKKRTHKNQFLGPFISHEMNRCIQCYRCVRFYKDYAGGTDLEVSGSADRVYFGRHKEGVLASEFSGNLAEVCPTGVFTDKTLRDHYTRKWDLTNSPSVCVHCSVGCNTLAGERYGSIRRILSRYNGAVNGYFLCDRGRFGYEFLNSAGRIKNVLLKTSEKESFEEAKDDGYLSAVRIALKGKKVAGIGSPRASLESNFALETLVGKENFYKGFSDREFELVETAIQILKNGQVHSPSLKEIEKADAVLILGEDLTNSAPMIALAVRQATRNKSIALALESGIPAWNDAPLRELAQETKSPVFIATPYSTKLDDLAQGLYRSAPAEISRLGFAVASQIDKSAPEPEDMNDYTKQLATNIATSLINAENPVIITGLQNNTASLLHAAANIALALSFTGKKPSLSVVFTESNTMGLGLMDGKPLKDLLNSVESGYVETLFILENNLYLRGVKERIDGLLSKCSVIVLDSLMNETAMKADILLPAGTFAESTGTFVNNEGRAQRYYRVLPDMGDIKDSWKYISEMIGSADKNKKNTWEHFDNIVDSFTESYPLFIKVKEEIPDSGFRYYNEKIARQTSRFSGRTAIDANVEVSEPKPPDDDDSPLAFSMEGYKGVPPSSHIIPYYWSPGWNSVQAMNKYMDEPAGSLKDGNPGVLLFNGATGSQRGFFKEIPDPFRPEPGKFLVVPVSLIFGSDELSSESKSVSELIPEPFLIINKEEINRLRIAEGDIVKLTVNKININVKVKADKTIPPGIAGLSIIKPRMPFIDLPEWGKIEILRDELQIS